MKKVSLKEWLEFVVSFEGVYMTEPNSITLAQNSRGYGVIAKVTYHAGDTKTYEIDEVKHPDYKPELPDKAEPYVWLIRSALVRRGDEYYRPAGCWSVGWVWKDGSQVSVSKHGHLDGLLMLPCTREEFLEDNRGYADGSEYP